MKKLLRQAALACLCLPLLAIADEPYPNHYVDISVLMVPTQSARDEALKMLNEGEPFTAMALALSIEPHAPRGGRMDVGTCFFFYDQELAKQLCTDALRKPIATPLAKKDRWLVVVIHDRAASRSEITRPDFPIVRPGKVDVAISCKPVAGTDGEPLVLRAHMASHIGYVNNTRGYLKLRPEALSFLTNKGQLLTVDRTGRGLHQDLEKSSSQQLTCQPLAAASAQALPTNE